MKRIQIQLTEKQEEAVRRVATRSGRSVAAVVREAVDRLVEVDDQLARSRRLLSLAGKYRDRAGAGDVARNHDRYLADAYRK